MKGCGRLNGGVAVALPPPTMGLGLRPVQFSRDSTEPHGERLAEYNWELFVPTVSASFPELGSRGSPIFELVYDACAYVLGSQAMELSTAARNGRQGLDCGDGVGGIAAF